MNANSTESDLNSASSSSDSSSTSTNLEETDQQFPSSNEQGESISDNDDHSREKVDERLLPNSESLVEDHQMHIDQHSPGSNTDRLSSIEKEHRKPTLLRRMRSISSSISQTTESHSQIKLTLRRNSTEILHSIEMSSTNIEQDSMNEDPK